MINALNPLNSSMLDTLGEHTVMALKKIYGMRDKTESEVIGHFLENFSDVFTYEETESPQASERKIQYFSYLKSLIDGKKIDDKTRFYATLGKIDEVILATAAADNDANVRYEAWKTMPYLFALQIKLPETLCNNITELANEQLSSSSDFPETERFVLDKIREVSAMAKTVTSDLRKIGQAFRR